MLIKLSNMWLYVWVRLLSRTVLFSNRHALPQLLGLDGPHEGHCTWKSFVTRRHAASLVPFVRLASQCVGNGQRYRHLDSLGTAERHTV